MSLGFFNLDQDVQKIVDAHCKDFNVETAEAYLKKVGGYKAYVRSLGGVFAKYVDFSGKITSIAQLYDLCNYVWGLYMIWGVDYSNGCNWTLDENKYKARLSDGSDRYYPRKDPPKRFDVNYGCPGFANGSDLPGIDEMLGGNYYKVTNCGQGVEQALKKAGLIPRSMADPAYHAGNYRAKGYGYKLIKNAKDLQPGDVLLFTQGGSIPNRSSRTTLDNWTSHIAHTAIVGKRDSQYIYMFDSGHAFTYEGKPINRRKIGEVPYQWCTDWIGIRLDCIADLTEFLCGWVQKDGKWFYYKDGRKVTGWKQIEWKSAKRWFFFDDSGIMSTGWKQIMWKGQNYWFFFGSDGAMRTGWQQITYKGQKRWFYFDESGCMVTGLHKLKYNGKTDTYYFDQDGVMQTGKVKVKCVFNSSGKLIEGEQI